MDKPSTDITYARPVTRPAWEPWDIHRWVSVAGVYLSAVALILMAITNWRTVDATLHRDADFIRQQREFNQGLVTAIEDLADKTGVLTSADFCPVRFRLRFPGGGTPAKLMSATLTRLSSDGDEQVGDLSSMDSGVIDFGLRPPGRYRLQVRSPDGMSLVHHFELLPGVPMDRVVICPSGALPEDSRNVVRIDVNWPPELASDNIAALIEILPGTFERQEWRWEPTGDAPPLFAAAATNGDAEWLLRGFDPLEIDSRSFSSVDPAAAARVPYRYCRLGSITFIHGTLDSRPQESRHVLGTLVYGASQGDAVGNGPHWRAASHPPPLECDPSGLSHWTIDIPQECVPLLLQRVRESARSGDAPT